MNAITAHTIVCGQVSWEVGGHWCVCVSEFPPVVVVPGGVGTHVHSTI